MQLRLSILSIFVFCALNVCAQHQGSCETMYNTAVSLFEDSKYDLAIKKVSAYRACINTLQNKKADDLLLKIYETVNKQKQTAVDARIEAEKQTKIAKTATDKAEKEQKKAESARIKEEAAKKEAIAQRDTATERLKVMIARKLLTDAIVAQNENPPQWHLSLLISEQAMKLSPSVGLDATIRKALSKLLVLLKEAFIGRNASRAQLSQDKRYVGINFEEGYGGGDEIVIWDLQKFKPIYTINNAGSFFFTANNYLVTGSDNKKALVIDFVNNKTICELPHTLSRVEVLAISPDDKYIITQDISVSESGSVNHSEKLVVWDIAKQKKINAIKPTSTVGRGYGHVFFFTYHGQLQIGLNWRYGRTSTWNFDESKEVSIPAVNNGVLSDNGGFVITYHPDKDGFQLSAVDGANPIVSTKERVKAYKFSNSYKYLLLFTERSNQLWDLTNPRKVWEYATYNSYVREEDICFSPNDKYFSLPQSNEVRAVNDGTVVATNYWSETTDSTQVMLGRNVQMQAATGLVLRDPASTLLFSYTGDTVVTSTDKGKLLFWAIKPNTQLAGAALQQSIISSAVVDNKGKGVYIGNYYGVYKYTLATSQIDTVVKTQRDVRAVDINKEGTLLAYGLENEILVKEKPGVYLLNLTNNNITHFPIDASIMSIKFNKAGDKLLVGTAVASFNGCNCGLWLIDLRNNTQTKIDSAAAGGSYYRADFLSNDNFVLFTTGFDAKLVNIATKKDIFRTEYGRFILYSEKFKTIVKAKKDILSIYNSDSLTASIKLKNARQFTGEITSLKLSPAAPIALIGVKESFNKSRLVLWDYSTNKDLNNFEIPGGIGFADFNPAAPERVIVCYDNVIAEYDLSYKNLLKQIAPRKIRELSKEELKNIVGEEFNIADFK